jgi:hypothetical protein
VPTALPYCSSICPARSSHCLDYSFSQLVEGETSDVGPDSDEVGARGEFASGFRSDRPQAATPAVPDHRSADVSADRECDANRSAPIIRRGEVYSYDGISGPPGGSAECEEGIPALDGGRASAQAERRTRPRRRRAFRMA